MKKTILPVAAIAGAFLVSCWSNNAAKQQNSDKLNNTASLIDTLVQSAVTDSAGAILEMSFDNESNSALFVFNGEIIEMTGDTVASGIKYSNDHYEFVEWHGEITLKKDGQEVFTYKRPKQGN
ncbi:MAG: MliC family protein [Prevotellaceae bacterium]|jgi:hypothetical protein|nr:MliC family protein [Prevotellaceae bacterium]